MRYRLALFLILLLLIFLMIHPSARAARHAVLIGIQDYPAHIRKLAGPVNDVISVRDMLVDIYGFSRENVTLLLDRNATRRRILETLSDLSRKTEPGDFIFVFYSGHGTSSHDPDSGLAVGKTTGALVPYDFRVAEGDRGKTLAGLIIGRRDLRPILLDLDRERRMLVVFDACFSGNAVRALGMQQGIGKHVDLPFPEYQAQFAPEPEKEPYPYRNIIYMSAAHETERAVDLKPGEMTFDGKAHGALTNALLAGLAGRADTNHDRIVTCEELYRYVHRRVQVHGHTPQILHRTPLDVPVFGKPVVLDAPLDTDVRIAALSRSLRIRIEGADREALIRDIGPTPGIRVVADAYDLLLKETPHGVPRPYATGGAQEKALFFEGERLDFIVESERDAHLLLLNVDPHGNVNVILPGRGEPMPCIQNGGFLRLNELGSVEIPLGVEYLKVFAFPAPVPALGPFIEKGTITGGGEIESLMRVIENESGWAETTTQVVTMKRPDDH
ncbi:MAG: caspase family protein [Deltaproteobacteria bacterium]|nr:caspase family protein [Deltaproteobacteria bacterium]